MSAVVAGDAGGLALLALAVWLTVIGRDPGRTGRRQPDTRGD
jgi:hypothetical protein